jgi:hypothetical protein
MNRSYSKIRHIQEANLMLESRRLVSNNRLFLMEQDANQAVYLTMNVPTKNGNYIDTSKNITFTIGPLGKNAAKEYTGVMRGMTLNGQSTGAPSNTKLNGEYITGELLMASSTPQLQDAITKIVSGDLNDMSKFNNYNATFMKKDPNAPENQPLKASGQQTILIAKVTKNLIPSQK